MQSDKKSKRESLYSEFEEIVVKYDRRIFNLLFSLSRNTEEAKDLTQETFIHAYRKYHHFKKKSKPYTWLYRIALNCWKNKVRYNKRRGIVKQASLDTFQSGLYQGDEVNPSFQFKDMKDISPEQIVENRELQDYIKKCIHSLAPKYRVPVVLYIKGLSHDEIAKVIKRPAGTVKSLIFRAKLILKEKMLEYFK